jgi:hypothetical protein
MKNVTITLSEELLAQVRVAAAREGASVSKFISERLSRSLGGHADPLAPFDQWLMGPGWTADLLPPPFPLTAMREDGHDPAVLRRRPDPDRAPGPERGPKAGAGTP